MSKEISVEYAQEIYDRIKAQQNRWKAEGVAVKPMYKDVGEVRRKLIEIRNLSEESAENEKEATRIRTRKHNAVRELTNDLRQTSARQERAFETARQEYLKQRLENIGKDVKSEITEIKAEAAAKGKRITDEAALKKANQKLIRGLDKTQKIEILELRGKNDEAILAYDVLKLSSKEFKALARKDPEVIRSMAEAIKVKAYVPNKHGGGRIQYTLRPYFYPEEYTNK
jgi:hypothetical protein